MYKIYFIINLLYLYFDSKAIYSINEVIHVFPSRLPFQAMSGLFFVQPTERRDVNFQNLHAFLALALNLTIIALTTQDDYSTFEPRPVTKIRLLYTHFQNVGKHG